MICQEYEKSAACSIGGWDSVVVIATGYGLDGRGVLNPCEGRDFSDPSRPSFLYGTLVIGSLSLAWR